MSRPRMRYGSCGATGAVRTLPAASDGGPSTAVAGKASAGVTAARLFEALGTGSDGRFDSRLFVAMLSRWLLRYNRLSGRRLRTLRGACYHACFVRFLSQALFSVSASFASVSWMRLGVGHSAVTTTHGDNGPKRLTRTERYDTTGTANGTTGKNRPCTRLRAGSR